MSEALVQACLKRVVVGIARHKDSRDLADVRVQLGGGELSGGLAASSSTVWTKESIALRVDDGLDVVDVVYTVGKMDTA